MVQWIRRTEFNPRTKLFAFHIARILLRKGIGCACGVMVLVKEMDTATQSSNPGETDCISHSTNYPWERYESNYSPPAMGK